MEEHERGFTKIVVDLPGHWSGYGGESLWAEPLGNDLFRLENVPFHAYGLNYHDIVRAVPPAEDRKPEVVEVVEKSGHQTFRIVFHDHFPIDTQKPFLEELRSLGAALERSGEMFLAVDVPPESNAAAVRTRLDELESAGIADYETCEMQVEGSFTSEPDERV